MEVFGLIAAQLLYLLFFILSLFLRSFELQQSFVKESVVETVINMCNILLRCLAFWCVVYFVFFLLLFSFLHCLFYLARLLCLH